MCVLVHLVHTGNSPSYLSYLVTTTTNITSRIHLRSAGTHRYEPLTTRLKFGEPCFSHAGPKAWYILTRAVQELTDSTFSSVNWKRFCLNTRSLHCDSLLPLVTLAVSVGRLEMNWILLTSEQKLLVDWGYQKCLYLHYLWISESNWPVVTKFTS